MYKKLTHFPFKSTQRIKGQHGCYLKVIIKENALDYRVLHRSRNAVMRYVSERLEYRFKELPGEYFEDGSFIESFGQWFRLLTSTPVNHFNKSYQKFETIFINDFNILLNELISTLHNGKKVSKPLMVVYPKIDQPDLTIDDSTAEGQKLSGDLKASESTSLIIELKTGNVKIDFTSKPTIEDIEFINQYLKYKLI
ncbi:hypothetical protein [Pseudomonas sp. HY7a-MNA-CIBAN-0227]|uniref:hypothetical protein n=1 Tax=Pseudomonas sp. HY7a-MNA-CIBAN-0227 TaxID=3140474 RepID=UPI0033339FFE